MRKVWGMETVIFIPKTLRNGMTTILQKFGVFREKNFLEGEKSFQGQHHSWCAELNTKGGCSKNFSKIGQKMIDL